MSLASKMPRGVRRLFRLPLSRARVLQDMTEEVQTHLAMRIEELRAEGMTEDEARAVALRRFGDSDEFEVYSTMRASRRARRHAVVEWLEGWAHDIRFAQRQFRKHRAFTAMAVLTLALGIGANTAIFSVVHRLLLAPLPYPDGNRIVMLTTDKGQPDAQTVRLWQSRSRSLESIGVVTIEAVWVQYDDGQDTVYASVSPGYIEVLGVKPVIGRVFTAGEARARSPVAMLSEARWQREFGGSANALGATIHVEGRPYTVIGVAPPELAPPMSPASFLNNLHPATPGVWLPTTLEAMDGGSHPYAYARLRPGVSAAQASRELQAIADEVAVAGKEHPKVRVMRAQDFLDPRETRMVQVLFAAVGVLLLIACANVANLLMSRAWTRRREFAVRVALGAGRARLARQVLTESVMLALAGGIAGVVVAWQTLRIIVALRPPSLDHLASARVDTTVLLWSAGISVATGILFGCGPALFAGARRAGDVLKNESRAGSGGIASHRMRSMLIVVEIALSLVLLVGAGLLVRSFAALQRMPLGFEPRGLVSLYVIYTGPQHTRVATRDAILARLRAVPGVTEASIGSMPAEGLGVLEPLGSEPDATGRARTIQGFSIALIDPNYFRLTRIPLLEGRLMDSTAIASTSQPGHSTVSREVVINHGLARRLWPDGGAVGARLQSGSGRRSSETYTVVGVVGDARIPGIRNPAREAQVYRLPLPGGPSFIVRTAIPGDALAPVLRKAVADAAPQSYVQTMTVGERFLRDALAPTKFAMALLTAFSIIALVLSVVGLYGVIAYSVTQRTREIGIRVALGAEPDAVTGLVVGSGLRLTAVGLLIGVVVAIASMRLLSTLLYAVAPGDPLTFVGTVVLVAAIALLASYVPARRALSIDPMEALRAD